MQDEDTKKRIKNLEYVTKAVIKALMMKSTRQNFLAVEILSRVKNDERFFVEFVSFLERNLGRREILLTILKKKIIEKCREIYSTSS